MQIINTNHLNTLYEYIPIQPSNLFNNRGRIECETREKFALNVTGTLKNILLANNYPPELIEIEFLVENEKLYYRGKELLKETTDYCELYDVAKICFKHTSPINNYHAASLIINLIENADIQIHKEEDAPEFIQLSIEINKLNSLLNSFIDNGEVVSKPKIYHPGLDIIIQMIKIFGRDFYFDYLEHEDVPIPELKFKLTNNIFFIEYTYPSNIIFLNGGGYTKKENSFCLITEMDYEIVKNLLLLNKLDIHFKNAMWIPQFISCIQYYLFRIDNRPIDRDKLQEWETTYAIWTKLVRKEKIKSLYNI
ncbi:hypothetical protein I5M27_02400 [Adhaeribacter sp. BT258]|uniref:Uncharacterized protein n=1 Tax=Adhaeribacter terrigena TaxID=2793070 RepID=A0ABS1BXF5_9BACT|nr:hypothetical protein [Adhaeribacter terrigena]MBK0401816.1 hypothetical protein [Adhaeribacter terrigena]